MVVSHQNQSNSIEFLNYSMNSHTESNNQLKLDLEQLKASEMSLTEELNKLNEQYQSAKREIAALTTNNEAYCNEISNHVRSNKQLSLTTEGLRQEKDAIYNDYKAVFQELTSLKLEVEEFSEKYLHSQNELSKLEQDFAVLEAERDEIYRQFIGDKAPPLTLATSALQLSGYYSALDSVKPKSNSGNR
jgi:chromosome segregation ATPase